jgi:hypothetical protein
MHTTTLRLSLQTSWTAELRRVSDRVPSYALYIDYIDPPLGRTG